MADYTEVQENEVQALNALCWTINDWAQRKGWNETPDSPSHKAEQIALMHSELSECLEYVRAKPTEHCPRCECDLICEDQRTHEWYCEPCGNVFSRPLLKSVLDNHIPIPGEHAELADLAIRLFHYCGRRGIDLGTAIQMKHAYNINRPYRHGKNL